MGFSFRNPIESPHVNEISAIRDFAVQIALKGLAERSTNVYRSFTVCAIPRHAAAAQGGKRGPGQC